MPTNKQCSWVLVNYRYPSALFPSKTQLITYSHQTQLKMYVFLWPPQRLSTLPGSLTWMNKERFCLRCCLRGSWWCLDVYSGVMIITAGYKYQWLKKHQLLKYQVKKAWFEATTEGENSYKPNASLPKSHNKIKWKKTPEQRGRLALW